MAIQKLSIEHVARIEGHGSVKVDVEDGELRCVEMQVVEPARMFESMVRGRPFSEVAYVASRICGICSASHVLASIQATEDAFGIEVSERTRKLRLLLAYGSYLQNHATHLYVLAAPDFIGSESIFPLVKTDPLALDRALRVKKLGNDLCTAVGGRSIHPITAVVGGFTSEPAPSVLRSLATRLDAAVDDCVRTGDLFAQFEVPAFETDGDMLALTEKDGYAICSGEVAALDEGWSETPSEYGRFLSESSVAYSNAKLSVLSSGQSYVVGAIARVNHSYKALSKTAKLVAAKAGLRPVWRNIFKNNISQAIELVDAAERCAALCRELAEDPGDSSVVEFSPKAGHGVAAIEAPRGTLFHELVFDERGRVEHADILTPTAQSLANLEADIRKLVPSIVDLPQDEFILVIEKLVRAYDPCLSCAVH